MRINIYLTNDEKKQLSKLKNTYYLSFSTIANILATYMKPILDKHELINKYEEDRRIERKLGNIQIVKKTSIKPKNKTWTSQELTYSIRIYLNGAYKKWEKETARDITNKIHAEFQNTHDPNWNGNEWQRRMPRLLKQNKEYYKKLLEC